MKNIIVRNTKRMTITSLSVLLLFTSISISYSKALTIGNPFGSSFSLPPQITISSVTAAGENYIVTYSPHDATDADGDPLTYIFTWTGPTTALTFTDLNHTGAFSIPASDFKSHTVYVVSGKSFDTKDYTDGANTVSFTTRNILPSPSTFLGIPRSCDTYIVTYGPHPDADADGDPLQYIFTFSNSSGFSLEIIDSDHTGGYGVFANLLAPHSTLEITGKTFDGYDYVPFSNTLSLVTTNYPPLQIMIGDIVKNGDNYVFNYSPHPDVDEDNDPISYQFTVKAAGGFSKTFSDRNHTGAFLVPAGEFGPHTRYTVDARTFDGYEYTDAANTVYFNTPNKLPAIPEIISPTNGQTVVAISRQIRFDYKISGTDGDGDMIESRLYLKGPGLDTTVVLPNTQTYLLFPQSRFSSDVNYQAGIDSRDGYEIVTGSSVTFRTPNTSSTNPITGLVEWTVYPNPVTDHLFIGTPAFTGTALVELFNTEGQAVIATKIVESQGTGIHLIDLLTLEPGIYFVRIVPETAMNKDIPVRRIVKTAY